MGCGASSAALNARPKEWLDFERALESVFVSIDTDGNGRITMAELAEVDPDAPAAMERMDVDNDQRISLQEWNEFFHGASKGDPSKAQALLQPYKDALEQKNAESRSAAPVSPLEG